ncbi:MAG TPA: ABC transporter ATP-binding protein [Solirubrobacteraceae bacterium]|nr:ABC transporter ATP-binding protein [Solirubrobacteraceae bacterium]
MPERIELEHVRKLYPGGNLALDDVSLAIQPGELLVLLGSSGSGKTTLLRCLCGIERISGGRIRIGERTMADDRVHLPPERRDLAMVFQDYALWPHMVARDNVAFALRRRGMTRAQRHAAADAMLARVGLQALRDRYPNELSGGEQQRVALARALVAGTGVLLCDEPLSNLDADLRDRLRIEIASLVRAAGVTTVYITHDQAEAFALADRVGVLDHGRLVQVGTPEEIYSSPCSAFVARFTGLSGALRGRLVGQARAAGEPVEVALPTSAPGHAAHVRARAMAPLRSGAAVQVMLRPTAVQMVDADSPEAQLLAVVRDAAFNGRGYGCVLALGSGIELTGAFSRRRPARGATVGVRLEASGALAFADDATSPVPSLPLGALPGAARSAREREPILEATGMQALDDDWD